MLEQRGRLPKFKVNRGLTDYERRTQYQQVTPADRIKYFKYYLDKCSESMTTIKMNSSYFEVVDRLYTRRGTCMYIGSIFFALGLFTTMLASMNTNINHVVFYMLIMGSFMIFFFGSAYILFKAELFNLTHNPIRFDRHNRMVYAFLYNKEVVAIPWDDVFFVGGM